MDKTTLIVNQITGFTVFKVNNVSLIKVYVSNVPTYSGKIKFTKLSKILEKSSSELGWVFDSEWVSK